MVMNKQQIFAYLNHKHISYEVNEHKAVHNMEEINSVQLLYPSQDAKNLFVRDDKKRNYYLISVKGNKRVDLKEFRKRNQTRPLSFASQEDLMNILHLIPGAVTPLGLLNDEERKVSFYLDQDFTVGKQKIGVHPNENTATVWLNVEDLIHLIQKHGNSVYIAEI